MEPRRHDCNPLGGHQALYTDFYELTMAQGYVESGKADAEACFDYFFRSNPFDGGYVVFAGLQTLLDQLEGFAFGDDDIDYLADQGLGDAFLEHLRDFEFQAEVMAPREGDVVFPNAPTIRVCGRMIEAQIVETLLLNIVNFQSLVATKASRMRRSAGDAKLIDFGLRRAQGYGGMLASRAAIVGGFESTSNVHSAYCHGLEATGTQAHSWIQSFEREIDAFRAYAESFPDRTILLVDTYDTLDSGVPNAIEIAKELEAEGHQLVGIRLDSGDLAYLAKQSRRMLDKAGFEDVKIAASNQLDEHVIRSLKDQGAPIDVFGVGTQLVTAYDSPALDGVYKLAEFDGEPRIKLSENPEKINFPGRKQVVRLIDDDGMFYGDAITRAEECKDGEAPRIQQMYDPAYPKAKNVSVEHLQQEALLEPVMRDGEVLVPRRSVDAIADYARQRLARLPVEHRRFENPHIYKVGLSKALLQSRDAAIQQASTR